MTSVKSPATVKKELEAQIAAIRRRLDEMRQYKQLIAGDGLEPDAEDKRLESELIVRLLRLEKQLDPNTRKKTQPSLAETVPSRPPAGVTGRRGREERQDRADRQERKATKSKPVRDKATKSKSSQGQRSGKPSSQGQRSGKPSSQGQRSSGKPASKSKPARPGQGKPSSQGQRSGQGKPKRPAKKSSRS